MSPRGASALVSRAEAEALMAWLDSLPPETRRDLAARLDRLGRSEDSLECRLAAHPVSRET